jgi:hypothetical protein
MTTEARRGDPDLTLTLTLTRWPEEGNEWVAVLDSGAGGSPTFTFGPTSSAAELLEDVAAAVERAELVAGQGLGALSAGALAGEAQA